MNVGGTLFFKAADNSHGTELWKSDGTASGTVLVKDICAGNNSSRLKYFTNVNGTLCLSVKNDAYGYELWKSDGTEVGTLMIKDILRGFAGSYPKNLTNVGGTLFFQANDGTHGYELWKSNGAAAGTVLVTDIGLPEESFFPKPYNFNGILFFSATDDIHGFELWKSNGTEAGTVMVKDIYGGSGNSDPGNLTNFGGTLFFTANDGTHGFELWKSDGTAAGTVLFKDIRPGSDSSWSWSLTNVGGTLFFSASTSVMIGQLWKSDGTTAGTVLVKEIPPGGSLSYLEDLTNVGGMLFFMAYSGDGTELWKSDGTEAGTVMIKDIRAGWYGSSPENLTNVGGTLFFCANDGTNGHELWKSDGTEAGTVMVKDIQTGGSSFPRYLTNVGGTLFFRANDGTHGYELWKSDGTTAGTVLVKEICAGWYGSGPDNLTNMGGTLFFRANDGENGSELWKSDGTAAGTVLVKDIFAGSESSRPTNLTNIGGTLFFSAYEGTNGYELWKSDGSTAGTMLVKDIFPGSPYYSSNPKYLTNVGGTLFFSGNDGNGSEIWKSDGTESGTVLVADITVSGSSDPDNLYNFNGTLFFTATDDIHGQKLWKLNASPTDMALSSNSIPENQPIGTVVGAFTTADPNLPGDSHTYTLVTGAGDKDNAYFMIDGNQLKTSAIFDFEIKSAYSIRVRTTDSAGLWYEKSLVISITDLNDPPTTRIWDGGGTNNFWMTPGNWIGDVAPLPGDYLLFPVASARQNNTNNYAPETSFLSILFIGGGYHLSGNSVLLTSGMIDYASGTLDNIVDFAAVTLAAPDRSVPPYDGSTRDTVGYRLKRPHADGKCRRARRIEGDINGAGGITKTGSGLLTLTGTNTYTGDTIVQAGRLSTTQIQPSNPSVTVEVQGSSELEADVIWTGTLRSAGGKATIRPITSGPLNANINTLPISVLRTKDVVSNPSAAIVSPSVAPLPSQDILLALPIEEPAIHEVENNSLRMETAALSSKKPTTQEIRDFVISSIFNDKQTSASLLPTILATSTNTPRDLMAVDSSRFEKIITYRDETRLARCFQGNIGKRCLVQR